MYHYAFFHLLYLRADGLAVAGIRRLVVTSATATTATAGCSQQATLRSQVAPEAFQPLPSREQSGHKQGWAQTGTQRLSMWAAHSGHRPLPATQTTLPALLRGLFKEELECGQGSE